MAIKADRSKLGNGNIPSGASLSESDIAEMNKFSDNIKMLIRMLGYKVFEEIQSINPSEGNTFYVKAARGADAKGAVN